MNRTAEFIKKQKDGMHSAMSTENLKRASPALRLEQSFSRVEEAFTVKETGCGVRLQCIWGVCVFICFLLQ